MCLLTMMFITGIVGAFGLGQPGGPPSSVGEYPGQNLAPKPYSFNYQTTDDHGNTQYRREQGDHTGMVIGSYGYRNNNGLYRSVDYVANAEGFKAQVKTNEPGVGPSGSNPADVQISAEPSPPGLQDMFSARTHPGMSIPAVVSQGYPGKKG